MQDKSRPSKTTCERKRKLQTDVGQRNGKEREPMRMKETCVK